MMVVCTLMSRSEMASADIPAIFLLFLVSRALQRTSRQAGDPKSCGILKARSGVSIFSAIGGGEWASMRLDTQASKCDLLETSRK